MAQPPRVYKTPAIVLRQRKLGDVDKIITLYSANYGKLEAVAKGVRRVTSRLAGNVEPLTHGAYMLAHGRSLDIITQAQAIENLRPLRDDLERLSRALYVAELVDRGTEEREENFALYRLLLDTLRRLAERDELDLALRYFEMALLDLLGYRPELRECVSCRRPPAADGSAWAPGVGGVVCERCRADQGPLRLLSVNALNLLRLLQDSPFQDVARIQITTELADELERHLREAIHVALDRDVRSASFLELIRRPGRTQRRAGAGPRTPV